MLITIEKAYEKDAESLVALQKQAFEELYMIYQDKNSPFLITVDEMIERISYENGNYYKILCNNELCGGIFVFKLEEGIYKIANIYVQPKYQNQGVANTAISLVEKTEPDAKTQEIDFPIDQIKSKKCYEKLGYVDTEKREVINDKLTLAYYRKEVQNTIDATN